MTPPPAETLRRVTVWSRGVRITHWALVVLLAILLLTGLLATEAPRLAGAARDYHYLAGHAMAFVLIARVFLMAFGQRSDRLDALLPTRTDWAGARAMLLFYVTRGRAPLPRWYAHNPLWMPLYLAMFALLALQVISGYGIDAGWLDPGQLARVHALNARVLAGFALVHILTVFWHEAKGTGSDISAMVSGRRIFLIDTPAARPKGRIIDIVPADSIKP